MQTKTALSPRRILKIKKRETKTKTALSLSAEMKSEIAEAACEYFIEFNYATNGPPFLDNAMNGEPDDGERANVYESLIDEKLRTDWRDWCFKFRGRWQLQTYSSLCSSPP
jgi:hypothetical protein